jgi:hypothetical protein
VNEFLGSPNGLFCCGLRNGLFQLCPPAARQILFAGALRCRHAGSCLKATCAESSEPASLWLACREVPAISPAHAGSTIGSRMTTLRGRASTKTIASAHPPNGVLNSERRCQWRICERKFCRVSWRRLFGRCVFEHVRASGPQRQCTDGCDNEWKKDPESCCSMRSLSALDASRKRAYSTVTT